MVLHVYHGLVSMGVHDRYMNYKHNEILAISALAESPLVEAQ